MPSIRTLPEPLLAPLPLPDERREDSSTHLRATPPPALDVSPSEEALAALDDLLARPAAETAASSAPLPLTAPVRGGAFTLAELALAGLSLVLATVLGFMGAAEWRARGRADRCAAELRTLAAVFETHRRDTGTWPAATGEPGAAPAGLETLLPRDTWTQPTPFGGRYAWVEKTPALAVTAFVPDAPLALSRRDLQRIDARLDDGNLATGRFRTGYHGWPLYLLAPPN